MTATRTLLPLLALLLAACGGAADSQLQLGEAFSFTPAVDSTAAYITITNDGETDDVLLAVAAEGFDTVELHDTVMEGGAAAMVEQEERIPIPAGETVTLEPGGLHVMMLGAQEPIAAGDELTILLTFAEAGEIEITSTVRDRADEDPSAMPMPMEGTEGTHGGATPTEG